MGGTVLKLLGEAERQGQKDRERELTNGKDYPMECLD